MTKHRLFVALPIPPEIARFLRRMQINYPMAGLRLTPERNFHFTALFLGNVIADEVGSLQAALAEVAGNHEPFRLQLSAIRPVPLGKTPRMIWAEVRHSLEFETLAYALREALANWIEKPDDREPLPHITLGRFKKGFRAKVEIPEIDILEQIVIEVAKLELWESKTSPQGAEYTCRDSWELGRLDSR